MFPGRWLRLVFLAVCLLALPSRSSAAADRLLKDPVFAEKCVPCHQPLKYGQIRRISSMRKTPEGWEASIERMQRLHRVQFREDEKRGLIKLLCRELSLTPAESRKVFYTLAGKDPQEDVPDEQVKQACARCHSYAAVAAQRRSSEEWLKLKPFHLALYPTLVYQMREMDWPEVAEKTLKSLARRFPFDSEEWRAWKAVPRANLEAKLAGSWRVLGMQPGRGRYGGSLELTLQGDGDYGVKRSVRYEDETEETWTGKATLYGGYDLRAELDVGGEATKGVFALAANGRELSGSWHFLNKPHVAGDETSYPRRGGARIERVSPPALKRGAANTRIVVEGVNLPTVLRPQTIRLGHGIKVAKVVEARADAVTLEVEVKENAPVGRRGVALGKLEGKGLLSVYDRVDYLRITPEFGLARVGGTVNPFKGEQFLAIAHSNGRDGVPRTKDDLPLGPVKVQWSLEEYFYSPDDRDVGFVGAIDQNGLFVPGAEGPNTRRPFQTNNVGNVWVVGTYRPEEDAQPIQGRAYLLVTVPVYLQKAIR